MTSPNARIIAETHDIYQTDNPIHLAYQAYNRELGRMSGQLQLRVHRQIYHSGLVRLPDGLKGGDAVDPEWDGLAGEAVYRIRWLELYRGDRKKSEAKPAVGFP